MEACLDLAAQPSKSSSKRAGERLCALDACKHQFFLLCEEAQLHNILQGKNRQPFFALMLHVCAWPCACMNTPCMEALPSKEMNQVQITVDIVGPDPSLGGRWVHHASATNQANVLHPSNDAPSIVEKAVPSVHMHIAHSCVHTRMHLMHPCMHASTAQSCMRGSQAEETMEKTCRNS